MILGKAIKPKSCRNNFNLSMVKQLNKTSTTLSWLNQYNIKTVMTNVKNNDQINYSDLVSIKSLKDKKINTPKPFLNNLDKMGEHAISYMKKLGEYKQFYESLPTNNKPPFLNLTIGGVNRFT